MSVKPIDVTGGESVYCFNESQLKGAFALFEAAGESGDKVRRMVAEMESSLTRNERAAAAFVTIDRLLKHRDR